MRTAVALYDSWRRFFLERRYDLNRKTHGLSARKISVNVVAPDIIEPDFTREAVSPVAGSTPSASRPRTGWFYATGNEQNTRLRFVRSTSDHVFINIDLNKTLANVLF
jgi:hypothetical protein